MVELAITFVGILQVLGIAAAFMLGRLLERPKERWPKGSLLQGGWAAWRIPLIVVAAVAGGVTVFLPIVTSALGESDFFGGGRGGGYGRRR